MQARSAHQWVLNAELPLPELIIVCPVIEVRVDMSPSIAGPTPGTNRSGFIAGPPVTCKGFDVIKQERVAGLLLVPSILGMQGEMRSPTHAARPAMTLCAYL